MIRTSFIKAIDTLTADEELTPFQKAELLKDLDWRYGPYDEITIDEVHAIINDLEKSEVLYKKSAISIMDLTKENLASDSSEAN